MEEAAEYVMEIPTKFTDLPEPTRKWLADLREGDLNDYKALQEAWHKWGTVIWFIKWVAITIVSSFMGTVALGETIGKVVVWFRGGH